MHWLRLVPIFLFGKRYAFPMSVCHRFLSCQMVGKSDNPSVSSLLAADPKSVPHLISRKNGDFGHWDGAKGFGVGER